MAFDHDKPAHTYDIPLNHISKKILKHLLLLIFTIIIIVLVFFFILNMYFKLKRLKKVEFY